MRRDIPAAKTTTEALQAGCGVLTLSFMIVSLRHARTKQASTWRAADRGVQLTLLLQHPGKLFTSSIQKTCSYKAAMDV
jgi:hypothetical protein